MICPECTKRLSKDDITGHGYKVNGDQVYLRVEALCPECSHTGLCQVTVMTDLFEWADG